MGGPGRTGRTRRSAPSRASAAALASLVLPLALIAAGRPDPAATIAVSGTQWGTSTCHFGATEGNVRFAVADLQDAGVSTYRVYGGMSRWEWQDDDGAYGAPSIDQIKADSNAVNWAWWDAAMTSPPNGSDYWVHAWMNSTGHGDREVWLSEWATYRGGYDQATTGVNTVLANMIRGARPGDDRIDGSHLFTFYDWDGFSGGFQDFEGLVGPTGTKRLSFYALRMGIRGLGGCRPTYQSNASSGNLLAITTRDTLGYTYLLVTNRTCQSATAQPWWGRIVMVRVEV
jgi:hypothetical protein